MAGCLPIKQTYFMDVCVLSGVKNSLIWRFGIEHLIEH